MSRKRGPGNIAERAAVQLGVDNSIIGMLIIGLLAGILAKAFMPGVEREPKGCLMTIGLGIVGSLIMGFLVRTLLDGGGGGFIPTLVGATIGAMLLIFLMRKFWR